MTNESYKGIPESLSRLVAELRKLPGVGGRSAQRLAFHLLKRREIDAPLLAQAIEDMASSVGMCASCGHLAEGPLCPICAKTEFRDRQILCVVEEPWDVLAFERLGDYKGLYHVLHGALSPLKGIGPDKLNLGTLLERVKNLGVREVILATNANVEGEATAMYLSRLLKPLGVRCSRLASGIPMGSQIEFADDLTLARALSGRRSFDNSDGAV